MKNRSRKAQATYDMTDPIADMLSRLRNANSAYHDTVQCVFIGQVRIAEILQKEGYIGGFRVEDNAMA